MSIFVDGVETSNPQSFDFVQGEDLDIEFEFQELLSEDNPDLSGSTLEVVYRKEFRKPVLGTLTLLSSDPSNATWTCRLPGAESAALTPNRSGRITSYVFNATLTYANGDVHKPVYGYLKMQTDLGA